MTAHACAVSTTADGLAGTCSTALAVLMDAGLHILRTHDLKGKRMKDKIELLKKHLHYLEEALDSAYSEIDDLKRYLDELTSAVVLTPDAPEMTVGDSYSVSESYLSDTCPNCKGIGSVVIVGVRMECDVCLGSGRVIPDEPE